MLETTFGTVCLNQFISVCVEMSFSCTVLENPVQEFPVSCTVFEIQFYLKIWVESGKVFFIKVLDLEKPYNFYVLLKTQFGL